MTPKLTRMNKRFLFNTGLDCSGVSPTGTTSMPMPPDSPENTVTETVTSPFEIKSETTPVTDDRFLPLLGLRRVNCCGACDVYGIEALNRHEDMTVLLSFEKSLRDNRRVVEKARVDFEQANDQSRQRLYDNYQSQSSTVITKQPGMYFITYRATVIGDFGKRFSTLISEHKLGTCVVSVGTLNPNSGNTIIGLLWSVDLKNYADFIRKHYPKG